MTDKEKVPVREITYDASSGSHDHDFEAAAEPEAGGLARNLQGRHMQMIAIGMFPQLLGGVSFCCRVDAVNKVYKNSEC